MIFRNRIALLLGLAIFALTACGDPSSSAQPWDLAAGPTVDPGIIEATQSEETVTAIVEFESIEAARQHTGSFEGHHFDTLSVSTVVLRSTDDLEALLETPGVVGVREEIFYYRATLDDGLKLIGQPAALGRGFDGAGTTIVVVDTGVDWTHDAFGSCEEVGLDGCPVVHEADFAPEDGMLDDGKRHGTNVAAIAAAVAPGAKIAAIDVFDGDRARTSDILKAINWSIQNQSLFGIAAINLSLGSAANYTGACDSDVLATPILQALNAGIVTVVASGNEANAHGVASPGCISDAVTVGAVYSTSITGVTYEDCTDLLKSPGDVGCFSNASSQLDLLAPGIMIDAGGVVMSGTSQATPHVAGAVAALRSQRPGESAESIAADLVTTGVPTLDPRNSMTFSRLDLDVATTPVQPTPTPAPPIETDPVEPAPEPDPEPSVDENTPGDEPFVIIDEDAPSTTSRTVTLRINHPTSAVMCISNETSCSHWVAYTESIEWTLPEGPGIKTVHVWFPEPTTDMFEMRRVQDDIELL